MIYQEETGELTVSPCFFVLDLAERKRRNRPGVSARCFEWKRRNRPPVSFLLYSGWEEMV